jgi:hypothetical protein
MSDQDKPSFTVVDKRRAAQEETAAEASSPATKKQSDPSSPTTDEIDPSVEETGDPATEPPDSSESTEEEPALPDPALLLSMAALHLDTQSLVMALLGVFDGHAWRSLGLIANHATGEVQKDLPSAQLAIDCVQFLLSKVENSLSSSDRQDIHRRLSDLRMNYLAKLRET